MKLELRSIKYFASGSQETNCYNAIVYADGKACVDVGNAGHGGCDTQHAIKGAPFTVAQINDWCKATLPKWESEFSDDEYETDLEMWCANQVSAWLVAKDLKRALKSRILYVKEGQLMEARYKGVRTLTDKHLAHWRLRNAEVTCLNYLPFDQALLQYQKFAA